MEQKALECPVCKSSKAQIAGENVKLSGRFEDKEFLTTELTVKMQYVWILYDV